jgi:hypothetical protein
MKDDPCKLKKKRIIRADLQIEQEAINNQGASMV